MKANRFIEARFGLMFRHITPDHQETFIMKVTRGDSFMRRTRKYRMHLRSAEKHNFIESYLGGSPEAHYYGLN